MSEPRAPVWNVALPAEAEPPFEVFVEGVQLTEGADFQVDGRWLRITRPLRAAPPRLGLGGRILLSIGIGVYKDRVDTVDVRYRVGGEARHVSGLPVIPPAPAG